jgi:arginine repressor
MVNYYKQLKKLIEANKLSGKQILLDEFETMLRQGFGFGTRKTVSRWLNNFEEMKLIHITKDVDGVWFVEVK